MVARQIFYSSGRFATDRRVLLVLGLLGSIAAGHAWISAHPQHDPWAPLNLRDPAGWATPMKLAALNDDVGECHAVLNRSYVSFTVLPPTGEEPCLRADRTRMDDYPLRPDSPTVTCPVAAGLEFWRLNSLNPTAQAIFGQEVVAVEHVGAFSCRRLYGRAQGVYSEHATGNAIDITGFRLADGTLVSILRDWNGDPQRARFLRAVRDGACDAFATVLSPHYNAAHADHFHLDQSARWRGVCR